MSKGQQRDLKPAAPPEETPENTNGRKPVTLDEIRTLAYQLWQQRGSPQDSGDEDWLRAEGELLGRNDEQRQALSEVIGKH